MKSKMKNKIKIIKAYPPHFFLALLHLHHHHQTKQQVPLKIKRALGIFFPDMNTIYLVFLKIIIQNALDTGWEGVEVPNLLMYDRISSIMYL